MSALLPLLVFGPMLVAAILPAMGRGKSRLAEAVGAAIFALALGVFLAPGEVCWTLEGFCGLGLRFRADGFRGLYALVAAFMWLMTGLFSREYLARGSHGGRYHAFSLLTLGATLGVFLSDDLYTTYIFFEAMSLTSYVLVAHDETPEALRAAATYLAVAVIGGLTMLMGLFMLWHELGTLNFAGLRTALAEGASGTVITGAWLTAVGFAAKAGLYPLHIWLPKAHPVAPAPASALLSGILTKTGVLGLIVICADVLRGSEAFGNTLLWLATATMALGAVLALFSVNLKRTLACSSLSQIGFIGVGLGMMTLPGSQGALAAYGVATHMVNHSLIKLCLFLAAGVVAMNTHRLNLNDIRGYGRGKPVLHAAFLLGALSLAGVPLVGGGYISKSLLHESLLERVALMQAMGGAWIPVKAVEVLFVISGGLTAAYMTKLYVCLFWERPACETSASPYLTKRSALALLGSAVPLPLLGLLPTALMTPIGERAAAFMGQEPLNHAIRYFSAENLLGAGVSLLIGAAVYLLAVRPLLTRREAGRRVYMDRWPRWLDMEDGLYRPLLLTLLPQMTTLLVRAVAEAPERLALLLRGSVLRKRTGHRAVPVGNRLTYALGMVMNAVARAVNTLWKHDKPLRTDFEYVLDASWREAAAAARRLSGSVSFGLLLLCVGLILTCLYLLRH